ncbi:MAG: histidinol dehydrogenase, partial [Burkholderiaceae bacterium]
MNLRELDTRAASFEAEFAPLLRVESAVDRSIERAAEAIVEDVRVRGDVALLEYTQRFDRLRVDSVAALEIPAGEMRAAFDALPSAQRDALQAAAERVRAFHRRQYAAVMQGAWTDTEA